MTQAWRSLRHVSRTPRTPRSGSNMTKIAKHFLLCAVALAVFISIKSVYIGIQISVNTDVLVTNVTQLFTVTPQTPRCTSDYFELTDYARSLCEMKFKGECEHLSCRDLILGNSTRYEQIRAAMKDTPHQVRPDSHFISATENCTLFKSSRFYNQVPPADEDPDFAIAFNILVHTDTEQFERLLRALYRPQHFYCIHIDAKAPNSFQDAVRSIVKCFDNVFVASVLERIVYWGYSRLQADINCMRDHVNTSVRWNYLINTAAQAFPLRTLSEMTRILKIYNGANDIEGIYGSQLLRSRYRMQWIENPDRNDVALSGSVNPRPPHNIDIVKGSAYGIFSRGFVEFLLKDQRAIDLLNWSKTTLTPDEMYWATLHHTYINPHLRTPGGYKGHPHSKPWLAVFAEWYASNCHGAWIHNVCVFGLEDLPKIVSRKEFFVNKFHSEFEPLALDCLEAWYRQKTVCPTEFDEEFYRNLPFIKK